MLHYKKFAVVAVFAALMVIGMSAMRPADDKPPKMNLKVLPKGISHDDLIKTMNSWKDALGVKCNFCHAPNADTSNHHLDFASDSKEEKGSAEDDPRLGALLAAGGQRRPDDGANDPPGPPPYPTPSAIFTPNSSAITLSDTRITRFM